MSDSSASLLGKLTSIIARAAVGMIKTTLRFCMVFLRGCSQVSGHLLVYH